jgi:hypothetical protein
VRAGYRTGFAWRQPAVSYTAPTREQELEMLKSQAEEFNGALQDIQQRIKELEGTDA